MTVSSFVVTVNLSAIPQENKEVQDKKDDLLLDVPSVNEAPSMYLVTVDITLDDPQMLIGQGGQTLFELQRVLRILLNKKLENNFHLNVDINDYKKKKIEYLKGLARSLADEVAITKEKKILPPMSAYERRIIHTELSGRQDIITESQGEGFDRRVVISPVI